ncbi:MAG: hypothetical protein ABW250_22535 [Pyrinomonadaceae bacterium]
MSTNVYYLPPQPGAAAADQREPVEAAVRELSARVITNTDERRRLHSRLNELRSADPSLRRSRTRLLPLNPQRPLTIYSFEEADAPAPLREAIRG